MQSAKGKAIHTSNIHCKSRCLLYRQITTRYNANVCVSAGMCVRLCVCAQELKGRLFHTSNIHGKRRCLSDQQINREVQRKCRHCISHQDDRVEAHVDTGCTRNKRGINNYVIVS